MLHTCVCIHSSRQKTAFGMFTHRVAVSCNSSATTQRDVSPRAFPLKDFMTHTFGLKMNQTYRGVDFFCPMLDCVTPAQGMTSWSRPWSSTTAPSPSATTCSSSPTWRSLKRTSVDLSFLHPFFSRAGCKRQGGEQYLGIFWIHNFSIFQEIIPG